MAIAEYLSAVLSAVIDNEQRSPRVSSSHSFSFSLFSRRSGSRSLESFNAREMRASVAIEHRSMIRDLNSYERNRCFEEAFSLFLRERKRGSKEPRISERHSIDHGVGAASRADRDARKKTLARITRRRGRVHACGSAQETRAVMSRRRGRCLMLGSHEKIGIFLPRCLRERKNYYLTEIYWI